jgi:hypothetical protein
MACPAPRDTTTAPAKHGGPERCPHPCSECPEELHHFSEAMIEFADDGEEAPDIYAEGQEDVARREALAAGCDAWFVCKHCSAWREVTDEDMDGPRMSDEEYNEIVAETMFG